MSNKMALNKNLM